ncbi:TPA: DNA-directed RNA polymerase subunit beta' [Candidatus Gracilibacteria bacterium]|nr:DNA-directed RNA polymerase subunit beta' [Candidatus Gracilibacteria bacterium]
MKQLDNDFASISLKIASPELIHEWSHGEVTKPETINYRTQRPELDGLFCERIFGPSKNYECYCGKYKRIRYKGITCEKCGVEVAKSIVRRERMGHIDLCVPVSHTWYVRSTPSRIGIALDMPVKTLEQVLYFAVYIITHVDESERENVKIDLTSQAKKAKKDIQDKFKREEVRVQSEIRDGNLNNSDLEKLQSDFSEQLENLQEAMRQAEDELEKVQIKSVITEIEYRNLSMKFGHMFTAGTGAEAVKILLEKIDVDAELAILREDQPGATGQKQIKIIRNVQFFESLKKSGIKPEWMLITTLAVIPPDIRPMVQLDGGRFAASDLNDLYRRIINRNNRLKRLLSIGAPEVICRNEKRMLQEAVDTLLNNSPRSGRVAFASDKRQLKSLSDMLKGKQGRFRQNLLGKRVDYSGRSVIVVGPQLKLHQCGIPKKMGLKLFKPFVIGALIQNEYTHNVKGAEKIIASNAGIVWDLLEEVISDKYVLLNRAPTLHRLGIQAFSPVLIEGRAIQIHPLVCAAYNADFDGDQMAVHLPLSAEAQKEAKELMLSTTNILKLSSGSPIITPSQDMVLGSYYITTIHDGRKGEGNIYGSMQEARYAYDTDNLDIQAKVSIRIDGEIIENTSYGRAVFNSIIPEGLGYRNEVFKNKAIDKLFTEIFEKVSTERVVQFADDIKELGFKYSTKSGLSIGMNDMVVPESRHETLEKSTKLLEKVNAAYKKGLLSDDERYTHSIKVWADAKIEISETMIKEFKKDTENHIYYMIDSGARGNWGQITQMCGMKGLVANPGGRTIELPIKSNLKGGFSIVEYFIATHGGRKGKSDTALKTAEAGYLTRRLVDAVQDTIIRKVDCGNEYPYTITREDSKSLGVTFDQRLLGRHLVKDLADNNGEVIGVRNQEVDRDMLKLINDNELPEVQIRSILDCTVEKGVCQKCYGRDLGDDRHVQLGTPVGIIAAQSIGEPGTQLTMRTFHMGGVADAGNDITQGLSRVEELFEARNPKTPAILSKINGKVRFERTNHSVTIHIEAQEKGQDVYPIFSVMKILVSEGDVVKSGKIIAKGTTIMRANYPGTVEKITESEIIVKHDEKISDQYEFQGNENFLVEDGAMIKSGDPLISGHFNLRELLAQTNFATVQRYITREVQGIYASQGQTIHDKHMEVIVREMFSRIRVIDKGDYTDLVNGELTDYYKVTRFIRENPDKKAPVFERQLLGLTRSALTTDSWLSAASFQETIRVLVDASISGKKDTLHGLKENVIIGKLIPAGAIFRKQYEKDKAEKLAKLAKAEEVISAEA